MIDGGNSFDWGRTARLYANSLNIYPDDFFETLNSLGVGRDGQKILDIGTGTGILPLNMAKYGGEYVGADLSAEMTEQAETACAGIPNVKFLTADAHDLPFENGSFDVVTALQCWVYFDKSRLIPELSRVIRRSGYMKRTDNIEPGWAKGYFRMEDFIKKDYRLPFTRESWCDRMTASRGVGATLPEDNIARFRAELMEMLGEHTGGSFEVLHEAVIVRLRRESE